MSLIRTAIKEAVKDFRKARPGYLSKVTLIDKFFAATILKLIPNWIIPNYVTLFRYAMIPLLIFLLVQEEMVLATIIFLITAFSDAIDGALARTRKQITEWGILHDPLADKLLIGSMVAILVSKYIHPLLALTIILIEFVIISAALYQSKKRKSQVIPAKLVGKLKMIAESVGISGLFFYAVFAAPWLLLVGAWSLYAAIALALLSIFVYKSI